MICEMVVVARSHFGGEYVHVCITGGAAVVVQEAKAKAPGAMV